MLRNAILPFILALAACVPQQMLFDKPGMAPGSGQDDLTDCQVEALQKVPPNNTDRRIPGLAPTTYTTCTGYSCTSQTYGSAGRTYSVDENASLRDRVTIQCMQKKGYTHRQ